MFEIMSGWRRLGVVAIAAVSATATLGVADAGADERYAELILDDVETLTLETAEVRLVDTRPTGTTVDGIHAAEGRLGAGETAVVQLDGRPGVRPGGAHLLNVTAVDASDKGYLVVFDCSDPRPGTSNLNYRARRSVANLAVVGARGGTVCISTTSSTHLVIDYAGRLDRPVPPAVRIGDTRRNLGITTEPTPDGGAMFTIEPWHAIHTSEPASWSEYAGAGAVVNLTVLNATGHGHVRKCEEDGTSQINFRPGDTVANLAVVGQGCWLSTVDIDLVVDLVIPIEPGGERQIIDSHGAWGDFYLRRVADSRFDPSIELVAGAVTELPMSDRWGWTWWPTSGLYNLTVVGPDRTGHVRLFDCTEAATPLPSTSTINFVAGETIAHLTPLHRSPGSKVCAYSTANADLVIDLQADIIAPDDFTVVHRYTLLTCPVTAVGKADERVNMPDLYVSDGFPGSMTFEVLSSDTPVTVGVAPESGAADYTVGITRNDADSHRDLVHLTFAEVEAASPVVVSFTDDVGRSIEFETVVQPSPPNFIGGWFPERSTRLPECSR
jgi:hypothetical protein